MYIKFAFVLFITSAAMFFCIEPLNKVYSMLLSGGVLQTGDTDYSYFSSTLIWIPLILLILSIVAASYSFYKN